MKPNVVDMKFKCDHENVIFIEEYCRKNNLTMDGFLNHCVQLITGKPDSQPEIDLDGKKSKKKQAQV